MRRVDVAIIGAGTAGLTARREVVKKTDNYVIIDDGPLGTTCARVGCMPSKALIQVANDFYRSKSFSKLGIHGGSELFVDQKEVMNHVRSLRDRFVSGVKSGMNSWEEKLIRKRAVFIDKNTLDLGDEKIEAKEIIIATGSRPIIPSAWKEYQQYFIDTDQIFDLEQFPDKMAVIGLGIIGIELGQALFRLGQNVKLIGLGKETGGLTDPEIQDYVARKFQEEMDISFDGAEIIGEEEGKLIIKSSHETFKVNKAIVAVGRRPNIDNLGLEKIGITLKQKGMPDFSDDTYKLKEAENIYLVGDVNGERPLLHETADEGRIAGYNVLLSDSQCFVRRVPLAITFSDPNIATIGKRHKELVDEKKEFVTGNVSFEGQGRSIVKLKEQGLLNVYAEKKSGLILGAELQAPDGEHLAHLISWAISLKLTVFEALSLPFYHPVIEEGLRTALRQCAKQISGQHEHDLFRCNDAPIR